MIGTFYVKKICNTYIIIINIAAEKEREKIYFNFLRDGIEWNMLKYVKNVKNYYK